MKDSYLGTSAVLEWRYSFSQAEMLLADNIPEKARTSYLALKAVVKTHINREFDTNGYAHKIPSYALKTILFFDVEKFEKDWNVDNYNGIEVDFFWILFYSLRKSIANRRCPHYWIEALDLFADMKNEDFAFWEDKLKKIEEQPVKYIASEWLEWNRYMRKNCSPSCINQAEEKREVVGNDVEPICCCPFEFTSGETYNTTSTVRINNNVMNGEDAEVSIHQYPSTETKWKIDYNDVVIEVY